MCASVGVISPSGQMIHYRQAVGSGALSAAVVMEASAGNGRSPFSIIFRLLGHRLGFPSLAFFSLLFLQLLHLSVLFFVPVFFFVASVISCFCSSSWYRDKIIGKNKYVCILTSCSDLCCYTTSAFIQLMYTTYTMWHFFSVFNKQQHDSKRLPGGHNRS